MKIDEIAKSLGFMVKRTCENSAFYYLVDENGFDKRNKKGEKICIGIGTSWSTGKKGSLPYIWHQKGYTKEILTNWWGVDTYVTNEEGTCYRAYDPTIKWEAENRRYVINFDWTLPATEENFRKILEEILRRFNA